MRSYEFTLLLEDQYDDTLEVVRDLLLIHQPETGEPLNAMQFKRELAAAGYRVTDDDFKEYVNASQFAKLNGNKIEYTSEVPDDLSAQGAEAEQAPGEVVSDLAQSQARQDMQA